MAEQDFPLPAYVPGSAGAVYTTSMFKLYEPKPSPITATFLGYNSIYTVATTLNNAVQLGSLKALAVVVAPTGSLAKDIVTLTLPSSTTSTSASSDSLTKKDQATTTPPKTPTTTRTATPTPTNNITASRTGSNSTVLSPPDNTLSTGSIAGTVIGASIGLALLTFLLTFLCMRRRVKKAERSSMSQQTAYGRGASPQDEQSGSAEKPQPKIKIDQLGGLASPAVSDYFPQSADDHTIHVKARTLLDHIDLFVANFYQQRTGSPSNVANPEMAALQPPNLQQSLSSLISASRNALPFIKHTLANSIITATSTAAAPEATLLPLEHALLLDSIERNKYKHGRKAGFARCLSQWRVLSIYLCPDVCSDPTYIAMRDNRIGNSVQTILRAFRPWTKPKLTDDDRSRSLIEIYKEAAELGTFLFSQPSEFTFRWPAQNEMGATKVAVGPALVKTTNERGDPLPNAQVLVEATIEKV